MDPLTITSTVIGLSARCVTSARALYELREKYKDASMLITAIYSESNVLSTSLAHIQGLCTSNPEALRSTLQERPELEATFDQALTGCVLVYSVLDDEVRRLYAGVHQEGFAGTMGRMKFLWKEEAMKDVLTQIRGQQTALGLLIQALQMSSIHEIRTLLRMNFGTFQTAAQRLKEFRSANPKVKAPSSVFEAAVDDVASLYSVDSTATSTNFIFDDLVINSQAYRRALAQSRKEIELATVEEHTEHSSDTDTVVEESQTTEPSAHDIPPQVLQRLSPVLKADLMRWASQTLKDRPSVADYERLDDSLTTARSEYLILKDKYNKVKQYFFDVEQKRQDQVKEREMLAAEYSRVVAEKAEFELENTYLRTEAQRRALFFDDHDRKRKLLTESHQKELNIKNARISDLEDQLVKQKEDSQKFREKHIERKTKLESLTEEFETLQEETKGIGELLKAKEAQLEDVTQQNDSKELELQRYRGLDVIIEQIRTLSPSSPGATPRPVSAELPRVVTSN